MVKLNDNYNKLSAGYLFPEVARRTKEFLLKNPNVEIYKLGIGNTTLPLTSSIIKGMKNGVEKLSDIKTYTGYGDEQGDSRLRKAIVKFYADMGVGISENEVFVSDGAKPDTANIQSIFSNDAVIAVQDPAYPVYVESNVIAGRTGSSKDGVYEKIVYMPCTEKNGFFPEVPDRKVDIIYICSPNNPTGAVATKEQLSKFIEYAKINKAIIIFDAAYWSYISDSKLPKSIYEINGAKECAIEINSFSKSSGFTGVRLGWSVVPMDLIAENTESGKINSLWNRRQTTMFNGASNIAQEGGLAAISKEGLEENKKIIEYYMENARIIRDCFIKNGFDVFGGVNAPYLWIKTKNNMSSWEFFDKLLKETHVVITPGSGFGPSGEGYFRVSAFGIRENVLKAIESINKNLQN
ncbi:MAG: LL-diaminopimelate aminotransferase [Candidatus Micrarchaeaceae archaeon]